MLATLPPPPLGSGSGAVTQRPEEQTTPAAHWSSMTPVALSAPQWLRQASLRQASTRWSRR
ncbi:MAG: hypothetical protein EXR73_04110 [Myxococcales bacterium]|nr:hypothetical protein [Myxococcales bacterium]